MGIEVWLVFKIFLFNLRFRVAYTCLCLHEVLVHIELCRCLVGDCSARSEGIDVTFRLLTYFVLALLLLRLAVLWISVQVHKLAFLDSRGDWGHCFLADNAWLDGFGVHLKVLQVEAWNNAWELFEASEWSVVGSLPHILVFEINRLFLDRALLRWGIVFFLVLNFVDELASGPWLCLDGLSECFFHEPLYHIRLGAVVVDVAVSLLHYL